MKLCSKRSRLAYLCRLPEFLIDELRHARRLPNCQAALLKAVVYRALRLCTCELLRHVAQGEGKRERGGGRGVAWLCRLTRFSDSAM